MTSLILNTQAMIFFCDWIISATLESLLQQENIVIEFWTVKKKKLEQCHQYVLFEQSAKQVSRCLNGGQGHTVLRLSRSKPSFRGSIW